MRTASDAAQYLPDPGDQTANELQGMTGRVASIVASRAAMPSAPEFVNFRRIAGIWTIMKRRRTRFWTFRVSGSSPDRLCASAPLPGTLRRNPAARLPGV